MSNHLDIIGSVIIAGMIILNFAFFMGERQNSQIESINKITQQGDLTDITATLRHDLLKVGFGCDTFKVLRATSREFVFRSDLENDGKLDTITYIYGDADSSQILTSAEGGYLYRIVNGRKTRGADLGIVRFGFKYYRLGDYGKLVETTAPADIRAVTVGLRVKSDMTSEDGCQYAQSEFTVTPKNLK